MEKAISHTLRNQHIRFVPARRLNFNLETPDGKVSLIYKSMAESRSFWPLVLGVSAPMTVLTNVVADLGDPMLQLAASVFFPLTSFYAAFALRMKRKVREHDVAEAYLYESGEQLLLRTHDGVLHKLDILHNDSHSFGENRDNSLIFIMENGDR